MDTGPRTGTQQSQVTSDKHTYTSIQRPTDASCHGIGFVLQQQRQSDEWRLVQVGFWFLSDVESRYAVIELEMFLTGISNFTIITDNSPLIPILNSNCLDEIENPQLQCLHARLMAYSFTVEWCKGAMNRAPDAHVVGEPHQTEILVEYDEQSTLEPSISEIRAQKCWTASSQN